MPERREALAMRRSISSSPRSRRLAARISTWPVRTRPTPCFIARASYDAAICMYHDQALVPFKTLAFEQGVNVTLGLPFVRTSPDHGTAFAIAGRGVARAESLIAALRLGADMAAKRAVAH